MPAPSQTQRTISVKGARVNNLKNVSVDIPRNTLTVITGLSGSGKSSLAFDTLYAEGQRRFVESLSAYARQFLDRMNKPDVEAIHGLPPAIAIQQQIFTKNPRSTVGTTTEVYDYIRLLFGRIGVVIDKDTGKIVRKDTPESVAEHITTMAEGTRLYVMFTLPDNIVDVEELKQYLITSGYSRVVTNASETITDVHDISEAMLKEPLHVVVDRLIVRNEGDFLSRVTDSLETAFRAGNGRIIIRSLQGVYPDQFFSDRFENAESQTVYIEPEPRLFSFNNPFGACPTCQGFGRSVGIDENLVLPDKSLSIKRGAIHPFRGETFGQHLKDLLREATRLGIPTDKPYFTLTDEQQSLVWKGAGGYVGIDGFFHHLEEKSYKTHYRVMISRYRGYTRCNACSGSRLRTAARQVFVHGKNIPAIVNMTLTEAAAFFDGMKLTAFEDKAVGQVLLEIQRRLHLLNEIGLEYLTLDRLSHTLSGGESQRINLATSLGSSLVGTLYVLDEPSIGLHPRDTSRLIKIMHRLRNLGNTVVIVEHDPDVIRVADHLIDIGPGAGEQGGNIEFSGTPDEMLSQGTSLTAQYLNGERNVVTKEVPSKGNGQQIVIRKPLHHNLKGDDVEIPLGCLTVITGVSGSGKSSLVHDVLYGNIKRILGGYSGEVGNCERVEGLAAISGVEMIDQTPIGRSPRSTPATYTKVFDYIRDAFASTQAAKQLGWKAGSFSFNIAGGRCDVCEGAGTVTVEMQFLPDIELPCEACGGTRYKREAQNIVYNGKNIVEVLQLTIDEAVLHFADVPKIVKKLNILQSVGLGYIRLGQPSTHLSGGEAQRIKLASHLDATNEEQMLFIFDEPTTGLHVHDVRALLHALETLVENGHSLVVIEHNVHVMASADWIIDMGPEGGLGGGKVVATGTPRQIAEAKGSYTATALQEYYSSRKVATKQANVKSIKKSKA